MTESQPGEEELFNAARRISDPVARAEFLRRAAGGDEAVLRRVEALLAVHNAPDRLLDKPAVGVAPTRQFNSTAEAGTAAAVSEGTGRMIGEYRLLQQLGEGGMGTVYLAEQAHPVHRQVALKLIKPGLDSSQVVARFEAERQALALMDHVNIARVFDAGATDSGRPYFVMELVRGVPITNYCDDNHLTPRERLELFAPVCRAIQHAHQKGVIHRDVKPSNVLVALYDDRPVPKVIDFGVAKAAGQKLTDQTLFTQFGTLVGTLEYMSPEQAEMSVLGIDTRSDVYSLGVLLYELLTGSTPLNRETMREAAFGEILRIIREEEPPRPSTRLSESGEAIASISALRQTEPAKLSRLMRGELDWIVMKALEKDRNRRYETANGFAADVQRYLADEPVLACPPSATYRIRKFARRNTAALTIVGIVTIAILLGIVGTTWQAIHASRQRDRAMAAENLAQLRLGSETRAHREADEQRLLAERKSAEAARNLIEARKAVDEWFTTISQTTLLEAPGLQPLRKKLLEAAASYYRGLLKQPRDNSDLRADLAAAHLRLSVINISFDRNDDAISEMLQGLELIEQLIQERPDDTAFARRLAGYFRTSRNLYQGSRAPANPVKAIGILKKAAELWEGFVRENPGSPGFQGDLAGIYQLLSAIHQDGDPKQSLEFCLKSRGILDHLVRDVPGVTAYQDLQLMALSDQISLLTKLGNPQEGERVSLHAILFFDELSRMHPAELNLRLSLARVHHDAANRLQLNAPVRAEELDRKAVLLLEDLVTKSPAIAAFRSQLTITLQGLATILQSGGRDEEAQELLSEAAAITERLVLDFPDSSDFRSDLAKRYRVHAQQKTESHPLEAEQEFRRALSIHEKLVADFPEKKRFADDLESCQDQLLTVLFKAGKSSEVERLYRRCIDHYELCSKKPPHLRIYQTRLAKSHNRLGVMLRNAGRQSEADIELRKAQALWLLSGHSEVDQARLAAEAAPKDHQRWHRLFMAYYDAGDWENCLSAIKRKREIVGGSAWESFHEAMSHWQLNHKDEALARFSRSVAEVERGREKRLLGVQEEAAILLGLPDPGRRGAPAWIFHQSGSALEKAGDVEKAMAAYARAIGLYQSLATDFPTVLAYTDRLVELLTKTGRKQEIEPVRRRAIMSLAALKNASPEQRSALANYCNDLAFSLLIDGRRPEAEEFVQKAIRLKQALATEFAEKSEYRFHLAHSYLGLATIVGGSGRVSEAVRANVDAGSIFKQLASDGSATADFRQWNAHALWQLGDAWLRLNHLDAGQQAYEQALVTFQQLAKVNPSNRFYRQEQGFSHRLLAKVGELAGRKSEALQHQREALGFYVRLLREVPDSIFYRQEIAYVQLQLAGMLARDEQFGAAEQACESSVANYAELLAKSPVNVTPGIVADSLNSIAWPLIMATNPPAGAVHIANNLAQRGVEMTPAAGHIWSTLGMARFRAGDWKNAMAAFEKADELGFRHGVTQLFASMALRQLGDHDGARKRYDTACRWIDKYEPGRAELRPLRMEASALMQKKSGVTDQQSRGAVAPVKP